MSDSPYIVDVDLASFEAIVIENSFRAPVLVDFWADWCNPCKILMPILANLVTEFHGQVLLAKVNSDEQQELSARYGVRNLPNVKLFRNGEVVEEFSGVQTESTIRVLLEPYLSRASDEIAMQAIAAYDQGEIDQALELLASIYQTDPENAKALILYGKLLTEKGLNSEALEVLKQLPERHLEDTDIRALLTQLEFASATDVSVDATQLEAILNSQPEDNEARYQLANLYIANGKYELGMDLLLDIMQRDLNFKDGIVKQTLFKVFDMLGGSGPLINRYRSKLYNLLH